MSASTTEPPTAVIPGGQETDPSAAATSMAGRPSLRAFLTIHRWLLVAIAAFFVVSFALSWLRAVEFQTTTWDEGLYQQALWSTLHGRAFYETADVETGGYGSLLQVHSVFLFYLLAPLYGLFPSQVTLFAVQSAVVALAALPLFALARGLTQSSRGGLVAAVVYLAWTPTLTSTLYDFHPEAFLPLELFALALCWQQARYRLGFLVATAAFATLEIAPVLTAFLAVFALLSLPVSLGAAGDSAGSGRFSARAQEYLESWIRSAGGRASLALLGVSVVAYGLLVYVRVDLLTALLGTSPLPQAVTGYVIGATPSALGLAIANLPVGFGMKLTYWLLILALLGFVPLLAPRALVLSVPWFAFTLLSSNLNYVTLGFQYGFIAASSLLVAFAYGLPEARRLAARWWDRPAPTSAPRGSAVGARARRRRAVLVVGLAALLAVNLALTPLDPWMQNAGLGSAYRLSYDPAPDGGAIEQLAGLVPSGATVVASDDLFPLVANDVNAYSFLWTSDPTLALPFDPMHLPTYVLLAEDRLPAVPAWLESELYDPTAFGVRGVVWSSGVGTALLFEAGFTGAVTTFGPEPTFGGGYYGAELASGLAALVATVPGSAYATVVESAPGTDGPLWQGPGTSLGPGNYSVEVSLRVGPVAGYPPPSANEAVVSVEGDAFGMAPMFSTSWSWTTLDGPNWTEATFDVTVPEPLVEFSVDGTQLVPSVETTLNFVRIVPTDPADGGNGA